METNKNLYEALCKAQSEIRAAEYDGKNPYFKSNYSTLSSVVKASRHPLSKNGLSIMQIIDSVEGKTYLKTRLAHVSGEYIESKFELPLDTISGDKKWHAIGSAITYARRYSLSAILGMISGSDKDDDGNKAEFIDEKQITILEDLLNQFDIIERNDLCKTMKVDKIETIAKNKYKRVLTFLKNKLDNKNGKKT